MGQKRQTAFLTAASPESPFGGKIAIVRRSVNCACFEEEVIE